MSGDAARALGNLMQASTEAEGSGADDTDFTSTPTRLR